MVVVTAVAAVRSRIINVEPLALVVVACAAHFGSIVIITTEPP